LEAALLIADKLTGTTRTIQTNQEQINSITCFHEQDTVVTCGGNTVNPLITGCKGSIKVWNITDGRFITGIGRNLSPISDCDITSDRRWLAASGYDGTIKVWNIANQIEWGRKKDIQD
jgi:WD40 repeat protein